MKSIFLLMLVGLMGAAHVVASPGHLYYTAGTPISFKNQTQAAPITNYTWAAGNVCQITDPEGHVNLIDNSAFTGNQATGLKICFMANQFLVGSCTLTAANGYTCAATNEVNPATCTVSGQNVTCP